MSVIENAPAHEMPSPEPSPDLPGRGFRRWLAAVTVLALLVAGAGFWHLRTVPPADSVPVGDRFPRIPFTEITAAAGIEFIHENGEAGEKLLPETMGGGCAFLDYDGDGDPDLLLINSRRWPWVAGATPPAAARSESASAPSSRPESSQVPSPTMALYENDGSGRFSEVTVQAGLNIPVYGMGVAAGDYDNDGDPDLYVTTVGENLLLRNDAGRFTDVTADAGVAGGQEDWSTSCGWFDYDNDSDLDLFVGNYLTWSREIDLSHDFQLKGGERTYGRPQAFEGTFPILFRNDGNGRFTDVSVKAGVQVRDPETGRPLAKSLGVCFHDFDRDGYLDVFVANDTVQNFLFHNRGNGTFDEIGLLSGVAFGMNGEARGAMGVDIARFRINDDAVGITIGNFANEMTALYVAQGSSMQFTDEAIANGLGPETRDVLTFGVFFIDADLDSRLDFFAANGHLIDEINRIQSDQTYSQPPQLFWNAGPNEPMEFVPLMENSIGKEFIRPIVGRGATYADIDADGDLDVLIATVGQRPRLLRNDQSLDHHWVRLKLIGTACNRDAIGARVKLHAAGQTIERTVMPTCSYLSQVEPILTFGLGKHSSVERIEIDWPDGSKDVLAGIPVDRLHQIRQSLPRRGADGWNVGSAEKGAESANVFKP